MNSNNQSIIKKSHPESFFLHLQMKSSLANYIFNINPIYPSLNKQGEIISRVNVKILQVYNSLDRYVIVELVEVIKEKES